MKVNQALCSTIFSLLTDELCLFYRSITRTKVWTHTAQSWGNLKSEYTIIIHVCLQVPIHRMQFVLASNVVKNMFNHFHGVEHYNADIIEHTRITCLSREIWYFKLNVVQSFEEDWRHKWDCQCHRLQSIPEAKMSLKIHRVSIPTLEQSKIPHIKAILMYTVPAV